MAYCTVLPPLLLASSTTCTTACPARHTTQLSARSTHRQFHRLRRRRCLYQREAGFFRGKGHTPFKTVVVPGQHPQVVTHIPSHQRAQLPVQIPLPILQTLAVSRAAYPETSNRTPQMPHRPQLCRKLFRFAGPFVNFTGAPCVPGEPCMSNNRGCAVLGSRARCCVGSCDLDGTTLSQNRRGNHEDTAVKQHDRISETVPLASGPLPHTTRHPRPPRKPVSWQWRKWTPPRSWPFWRRLRPHPHHRPLPQPPLTLESAR